MKSDTTRAMSDAHEIRVAQSYHARRNPNSGALSNIDLKGDCRTEDLLIECKCTRAASISVSLEVLRKTAREASVLGKRFVIDYEFQGSHPGEVNGAYALVERSYFTELRESHRELLDLHRRTADDRPQIEEILALLRPHLNARTRAELSLVFRRLTELGEWRYDLSQRIS